MNGAGNFTHKAQEAILFAQDQAREAGQQQIDALHLLLALASQEGSVVLTLLQKLKADIENLKKKTKTAYHIVVKTKPKKEIKIMYNNTVIIPNTRTSP